MSYELSKIINSIICADCYDVLKKLPDKGVDLVLTDPPYGIGESKRKKSFLLLFVNTRLYINNS